MPVLSGRLLHGTHVKLTACTLHDVPTMIRWYQDDNLLRLLDALPARPRTESGLTEWITKHHKASDSFLFGVRLMGDDTLIGCIEIDGVLWTHQTAWLAIVIGSEIHRGKGYGCEAMELALRFAFLELNLYRVQLTVFGYNERAIALYDKLGFQREGVYRECLHREGRRYDMLLYGLLRHEWAARQTRNEDPQGESS
ncbi:MAG TPA: GNAT family protein [Herpetosiphonaceae bacterium]